MRRLRRELPRRRALPLVLQGTHRQQLERVGPLRRARPRRGDRLAAAARRPGQRPPRVLNQPSFSSVGARMIFRQLFEPLSSTYTYLLGCEATGQALLIDPVVNSIERDLAAVHGL